MTNNILVETCGGRGEIIGSKFLVYFLREQYCQELRNIFNLKNVKPSDVETELCVRYELKLKCFL